MLTPLDTENIAQQTADAQPDQTALGIQDPLVAAGSQHADFGPVLPEHIVWGTMSSDDSSSLSSERSSRTSNSTEQKPPKQHNQLIWHTQTPQIQAKDMRKIEKLRIPMSSISVRDEVAGKQGPPAETYVLPSRPFPVKHETYVLPSRPFPLKYEPQIPHANALPVPRMLHRGSPNMHQQPMRYRRSQSHEPTRGQPASASNSAPSHGMQDSLMLGSDNEIQHARVMSQWSPERQPSSVPNFAGVPNQSVQDHNERCGTVVRAFNEKEERRIQAIAQKEFVEVQEPNLKILRKHVPLNDGKLTSIGSISHATGECKPCVFCISKKACPNSIDCCYCHFPHRRPGKRKKLGKNERYRKLVDHFADVCENDPDNFVIDVVTLPPSLRYSESAIARLVEHIRERVESRRHFRLMQVLHNPSQDFDDGCESTKFTSANGSLVTLALVSL